MYPFLLRRSALCIFLLAVSLLRVWAEQSDKEVSMKPSFTINGYVKNANSGEALIKASIKVVEVEGAFFQTNEYGFFSITLPRGTYTLLVKAASYSDFADTIVLDKDIQKDLLMLSLKDKSEQLSEVVVSSKRANLNIVKAEMGVQKLDISEIAKLPVLLGEKDVLKILQLLPGVKSAGEGGSGFYVRGGAADQNLILLDEAPVYNASHLLGFFSTFNSDAIKDASIYKGIFPAQFGGRVASVLDMKMNEGNAKDYHVGGGIGLLSARLLVEGPIIPNKGSFLITGRRTYVDVFTSMSSDEAVRNATLYFYDLNLKANYKVTPNNHLFVSGYFGRDVLGFGSNFGIQWGNATATLRWNSILTKKLFSNTSLIFSDYSYKVSIQANDTINFSVQSQITDWNLKQDFQYKFSSKFELRFGGNVILHRITPTRFESNQTALSNAKATKRSLESSLFVSTVSKLAPWLSIDLGLRASLNNILGEGTFYLYDKNVLIDSVYLPSSSIGKSYFNLEPRLAATFVLSEQSSIKVGYTRATQSVHLLSNSTSTNPTDQWIGNTYNIQPEVADMVSVGYFQNFLDNAYESSIETYYKLMQNQIDYRNGADLNNSTDVESQLLYGVGRAYGAELFVKKKTGKLTGWISYTLARTERQIDGINNNAWYLAKQDRTHDLSVVASYQLSRKWSISGLFIFYTGSAVTFPHGKYSLNGNNYFLYTERNGSRMPSYHRLDLSATYELDKHKRFEHSLTFGFYNIYNRENAYTISFETNPKDPSTTRAMQTSLFGVVPNITYNFRF